MQVETYQDAKGYWRWRLKASGHVKAEGGDGYSSKSALRAALRSMGRVNPYVFRLAADLL